MGYPVQSVLYYTLKPNDLCVSVTEIGPFTLGDTLKLRCVSTEGRPAPNVTWWRDNAALMDATFKTHVFESGAQNVINDLEILNLDRQHNGAILTCRAVNDIHAPAAVTSVKILMHCKYEFLVKFTHSGCAFLWEICI